jgi:DNA-binding XRE family transcriptional regulator
MKDTKRKKLEAAGWRVGSADELLGLSAVESALVDLRLALSQALRERRERLHMSQRTLAERIKSSQSRVAKMEAADAEVSFELLLRALLATGATRRDIAVVFGDATTTKRKARPRSAPSKFTGRSSAA